MPFQILSLSGGGYRGLFTAEILEKLEEHTNRPIGECFDLIAGTSIGGIIAIGLAMGKTASEIKKAMLEEGEKIFPPRWRPNTWVGKRLQTAANQFRGPIRRAGPLRKVVENVVGEQNQIGHAKARLLIPAMNMTDGKVQMFKTPHHDSFVRDLHLSAADVAMATSAAPFYFPLAKIGERYYADGGLFANSPDLCAIHEAAHFCGIGLEEMRLLSIGTTSSRCALPGSINPDMGQAAWLENERLTTTVFSAQQQLVDFVVRHQLGDRYTRLDTEPSAEQLQDLGLDLADTARRRTLLGLAEGVFQTAIGKPQVRAMLDHKASRTDYSHKLRVPIAIP